MSDRRTRGGNKASDTNAKQVVSDTLQVCPPLANAQGGWSAANPAQLALNVNLANGGWEVILAVIHEAGKYVSLDLSACAMDGTEFDPGSGNNGAYKVTALVLPNTATSIEGKYWAYNGFTILASISGSGIETVGEEAFYRCVRLASVSLPAAPPAISNIFYYTYDFRNTSRVIVSVPTGAVPAYTSKWGVSATTAANSALDVYGYDHVAVTITDAAE
ncbi:MAG: leucine-rich repeat domain-containing protein [Treponema sp.]|jgi:hypothetical protein|nr:leucine-rich repeat domain-containing protein [Treponema sp.]